jgi:hypothetical protein
MFIEFFQSRMSPSGRVGRHKERFANEFVSFFGDGSFTFFIPESLKTISNPT